MKHRHPAPPDEVFVRSGWLRPGKGGLMSGVHPRQALALRQQRLLLRSRQLRAELQQQVAAWQPALTWAERNRQGWLWLRQHPWVPLTAAATLVVLRPRRAWRWGMRLWWGWRTLRRLGFAANRMAHGPPRR